MNQEPLILHLREKVESICLDEAPSSENERRKILNLFHAMIRCLSNVCNEKDFDEELDTILQQPKISREDFCSVTMRLIKTTIVIPYSTRNLENKLQENNLTLKDLEFFDKLQNEEQMYRYMQKLFKKVPQVKNTSTFYKLLVGIVVGFSLLNYGILNPQTTVEIIQKTNICPIKDLSLTAPVGNIYREDTTFNTLPYILWTKLSLKYEPRAEMTKNEKIISIANLILEGITEEDTMMSIDNWFKKIIVFLPNIKIESEYKYSTRMVVQKEFDLNPNPQFAQLYWIHYINELRIIRHGNIYNFWQENVLEWFHGHPLSNPELQSLLCEMFQVFPECHDSFCYLRNIFFKQKQIPSLASSTQLEVKTEENEKIKKLEAMVKLQNLQLIKYKVNEIQDLLPESRRRQRLKKFSNAVPFPASTLPHILLQFLDSKKRTNDNIEELAKNILKFTEPRRIRINKSQVTRENWIYSSSNTMQMTDIFKETWKEEKYSPKISTNEDPISFHFRMQLHFTEWDIEKELLNAKQGNDVRDLSELYQLNLVIDIYKTIKEKYGEDSNVEQIFIENSKQWVSRKQLTHIELEPLLTEIYDFDQILTHHGKFL